MPSTRAFRVSNMLFSSESRLQLAVLTGWLGERKYVAEVPRTISGGLVGPKKTFDRHASMLYPVWKHL